MSIAPPAGPITATGTASRNIDGQAISITVFSTIKPGGKVFLPILFAVTKRAPKLTKTLVQLSFIHFARWSLVQQIPHNGPPQPEQKLRYTHMYFESNFNGGWEEYIDAFSHILTSGMAAFWGSSFGFPKALPVGPFPAPRVRNPATAPFAATSPTNRTPISTRFEWEHMCSYTLGLGS